MKYFKNTELAKIYNVSEKSVRNWIQAARDGKLDLELFEKNEKFWVANTRENTALLEEQAKRGKKYKNTRALKVVTPVADFYEFYGQGQVLDIISSLKIHKEIPIQYSYVDGGAQYWDNYANRLNQENAPNILNRTVELLHSSLPTVESMIGDSKKINIVDLGPGNGLPVKELVRHIHEQGKLARYIAIDSSQEMLDILEKNIDEWFDGQVKFEGHVIDFSYQRFDNVFLDDYSVNDEEVPTNIVCLLGGTLSNFKSPAQTLQTINQSMCQSDILIYSAYLDTPDTRRYFDFNTSNSNQKLRTELILGKLGISDDLYKLELGFNEALRARLMHFIPTVDICVEFKFKTGTRRVELAKNNPILLWRHWHKSPLDMINQFDEMGFDLMQSIKSTDKQYLLTISTIKVAD